MALGGRGGVVCGLRYPIGTLRHGSCGCRSCVASLCGVFEEVSWENGLLVRQTRASSSPTLSNQPMQGQNTIVAEHERLTVACCGARIESDYGYARDIGGRGNGRYRRLESCPYKTARYLEYVRDILAFFIVCAVRCAIWAALIFGLLYVACDTLDAHGVQPGDIPNKASQIFLQLKEDYYKYSCQPWDYSPYGDILEEYRWLYFPGVNGFLFVPDLE